MPISELALVAPQSWGHWLGALALNAVLIALAQRLPVLTRAGWVHAGCLGTLLWGCLGPRGWLAVVLYLVLGSAVTRLGFRAKLARGLAEARGAQRLVLGVNAIDYSGYPDCRPDYLEAFQGLADLATRAGRQGEGTRLWAPLVHWSKTEIVRQALRLGVPIADTWSCYSGGSEPCGVCDSCRIRDAALIEAGRPDLASRGATAAPPLVEPTPSDP